MQNYISSDYALNKYSEGIVYRFADGIVVVTMADYLAENPDKTEYDFRALKKLSDDDYFERDRKENAQTKKNVPFGELEETMLCCAPSPLDILIGEIDAQEQTARHGQRLGTAKRALGKLTDAQRRRYLLHVVDGLSVREIAEIEGAHFTSVSESLQAAKKKIKKVLSGG